MLWVVLENKSPFNEALYWVWRVKEFHEVSAPQSLVAWRDTANYCLNWPTISYHIILMMMVVVIMVMSQLLSYIHKGSEYEETPNLTLIWSNSPQHSSSIAPMQFFANIAKTLILRLMKVYVAMICKCIFTKLTLEQKVHYLTLFLPKPIRYDGLTRCQKNSFCLYKSQ